MSTVIFHWETPKGFESPHAKKKLLARWGLTCKAFGVHLLYCVTKEELFVNDSEIVFKTFSNLGNAIKYSFGEVVYIEQGGQLLSNFKHPENAVYVFGSDYEGLDVEHKISINSKLPIHAEIAAGIVLSNRFIKCH